MHTMTAVINTITEGCACAEALTNFDMRRLFSTDGEVGIVEIKFSSADV